MKHKWWLFLYPTLFLAFSIYTYSRVDPNIVLSSQSTLVSLQGIFRNFGYEERLLSSITYLILVSVLFFIYLKLVGFIEKNQISERSVAYVLLASVAVLFLSFPSLSHDIFNYIFNAKMVLTYHANPHIQTALDFPQDPWLIFMHNIHTPAPYGYGWTLVSLLPAWLGQDHLKLSIWIFRFFMAGLFMALILFQRKILTGQERRGVALFALNPLILIETISSIHNDVVMILPAWVGGYLGIQAFQNKTERWKFIPAILLFGFSVSIKYASAVLLLGLAVYYLGSRFTRPVSFGAAHALSLSTLLLTERSKRFLPWYLFWPLSFLPLIKERAVIEILLIFSFTSLLSYLPFLYLPESESHEALRTTFIFVPAFMFLALRYLHNRVARKRDFLPH